MNCKIVGIVSDTKDRHLQLLHFAIKKSGLVDLGLCSVFCEDCQEKISQDGLFSLIVYGKIHLEFEDFVELYKKEKEKAFASLKGNFFIIFFDKQTSTQYFLRSLQCLMPFYWSEKKEFIFSNSYKLLFSCQSIAKKIDPFAVRAYLHLGFIPSPYTPIQDLNELLPGFLLVFTGQKKLSLICVKQEEEFYHTKKIKVPDTPIQLSWKSLLEELYHFEQPNSLIFFPAFAHLDQKAYFIKQRSVPSVQKSLPPFKLRLPNNKLFNWFSLWALKQRSHNKDLLEFETSPFCFFTTKEVEKYCPSLTMSFDLVSYLAKIQSEKGFLPPTYPTLYEDQNTFFHFANTDRDLKQSSFFEAQAILQHFLTTNEKLENNFIPRLQEEAKFILKEGVLVDLSLISKELVDTLEVANPFNLRKLWNLIILELWFRIFIEMRPTVEGLTKIENTLSEQFALQSNELK
jgi:hypothetical protein